MGECFYKVLGVDRKATTDQIKKAFKDLALKWHPDKNRDSIQEAQVNFLRIQEAYETLGNPDDRAWYDSHRLQILQRNAPSGYDTVDPSSERINIYKYFRKSCFSGYTETINGIPNPNCFYTVYDKLFSVIVEEELRYSENPRHSSYRAIENSPRFGTSEATLQSVLEFYNFWSQFSSQRSFQFCNKWNAADGYNRTLRRQLEAENKVARLAAKKEFNTEVRALCVWLKNRDPRLIYTSAEHSTNSTAKAKIQQEQEQLLRKKEEQRLQRKKLEQERWTALEKEKEQARKCQSQVFLEDSDTSHSGSVGHTETTETKRTATSPITHFICEPCRRSFRSKAQFNSHERSKKHKKNIQILLDSLTEDDQAFSDTSVTQEQHMPLDKISSSLPSMSCGATKKSFSVHEQSDNITSTAFAEIGDPYNHDEESSPSCSDLSDELNLTPREDHREVDALQRLQRMHLSRTQRTSSSISSSSCSRGTTVDYQSPERKHQETSRSFCTRPKKIQTQRVVASKHVCTQCGDVFPTRNKLFRHLEKDHAVFKAVPLRSSKSRKSLNPKTK